jgi:plasmid maintenance system antidote protein VapI
MHTGGERALSIELRHISEALIASGYTSLDAQAKALGIHRTTAWTIVKNKHKLARLSAKTIDRILTNPGTPSSVRAVVQQYLSKRSDLVLRKRKLRRTACSR